MNFLKRGYLILMVFGLCLSAFSGPFSKGITPWFYLLGMDISFMGFNSNPILSNSKPKKVIIYQDSKKTSLLPDGLDTKTTKLPLYYFYKNKLELFPIDIYLFAICKGLSKKYSAVSIFKTMAKKYHPDVLKLGLNIGHYCVKN